MVSVGVCQEGCICGELCTMEGGGTGTCALDYLTCAQNVIAVECPHLPQPATLELGDVCHNSSECPACSSGLVSSCLTMARPFGMQQHPTVTSCQVANASSELPGLSIGDICKSGGPETGPGVNRRYDCPMESTCLPVEGMFAIGGEVDFTCQAASGEVPLGGACSVSGSMLGPPLPCERGLECVITNPGMPEVDLPNAGYCMESSTALPFAAPCIKDGTMCAPTLKCTWTSTMFPSSSGYTCQRLSLDSCEDANERSTSTAEAQAVPAGACASSSGYAFGLVALTSIFLGLGGV